MDFAQPIPHSSHDIFNKHLESQIDRSLALPASYASSSSTASTASSPGVPMPQVHSPANHHARKASLVSAMSDTSASESWTLEYARGAETRRPAAAAAESDLLHDEHSLFLGASPVSTAAHHASAMTLGAGIFADPGGKRATAGSDDEFDPDRSIARLINKLGKGRGLSMLDKPQHQTQAPKRDPLGSATAQNSQAPPRRVSEHKKKAPTTFPTSRPRQPSPLRRSPINAYVQDEADETNFSLFDATPRPAQSRQSGLDSTGEGEFSKLARRLQGDLDGLREDGSGGPAVKASKQAAREKAGLRVESGIFQRPASADQARKRETSRHAGTTPQAVRFPSSRSDGRTDRGTKVGVADLTSLTGMMATPARGLGYKGVGEDAAAPGVGDHIPESLGALQDRIQQIQAETRSTQQRIQQLETELERTKDAQARAERVARENEAALQRERRGWDEERRRWDDDRTEGIRAHTDAEVREGQWRAKYDRVLAEKNDLENLVLVLKSKVSTLTRESASELAKVQALQERLASPVSRAGPSSNATTDLLERLLNRIEILEGEVKRLSTVVNEAVLVRHEMTQRDRCDIGVDAKTTRSRKVSGQSQLSDGVQAAAYDGAARQATRAPAEAETGGESSPSPRSSFANSRRVRRHRHRHRDTHHDSRSDEPQADPAASPFPSIRGAELEKDFFTPEAGSKQRMRTVVDDLIDEGYGGEEQVEPTKHGRETIAVLDELERALNYNHGKLPPQTIVMSVLREIEDDYQHYLGIYAELADQYKRMSPLSKKRGVLAEHLKEVIDTMEHKASQVARLTEVLEVKDKAYKAPVLAAARQSKARMSVPDTIRAVRRDLGHDALTTPAPMRSSAAAGRP